jgi:N6-adenosine-specific RNA methylase IME4
MALGDFPTPAPTFITFQTILMDPPWNERGAGKCKRGADRHYKLMGKKRIRDTILQSGVWRPARDSHLYCWVTNNKLPDGLWLVEQLGFRYVTNVAWPKDRSGLGQYFRGRHELMLFAVRGDGYAVRTERKDLPSCIPAPHVRDERGKIIHSAKPPVFRQLIEDRSHGPRLEMFAREEVPGWAAWGNEVGAVSSAP